MPHRFRPQRIRDPLHDIIEFGRDEFHQTLWDVIQTRPFQRLRRIKQLGFSELVYPGATHTRFAHSIGVFHTARKLMRIIERHIRSNPKEFMYGEHQSRVALAAALVHDIGHGMFSHAFEDIGRKLNLRMANHEVVTKELIKSEEMRKAFEPLGGGFADDVAILIGRNAPQTLYDAVVSSQFDADRLDYMQRDRLMTGVRNSAIDFAWLIDNLEIASLPEGSDNESIREIETFVLGPKAIHAAETFVLSLFQLYPTIYHHKATRAAEKLFSALMLRLFNLIRDNQLGKTGLPRNHPIVQFARFPDSLDTALALDDTVFWGAIPMLIDGTDQQISMLASRLKNRELPKAIDIGEKIDAVLRKRTATSTKEKEKEKEEARYFRDRVVIQVEEQLTEWCDNHSDPPNRVLMDRTRRDPYKQFQETKGPLNQIRIRTQSGDIIDIESFSSLISGIRSEEVFRVYHDPLDRVARDEIERIMNKALKDCAP